MKEKISRVFRRGTSYHVLIPKDLWDFLAWRENESVHVLCDRTRLIITRIPLEQFRGTTLQVESEAKS